MIDPNEPPCVINLRNCQTQLDADGCQVGVSRQALEETLADYSRLRAEAERLTKERRADELIEDERLGKALSRAQDAIARVREGREAAEEWGGEDREEPAPAETAL